MNTKYLILITGILAIIHYLLAGNAPTAATAPVAPQVPPATTAPTAPIAPTTRMAPVAPQSPVERQVPVAGAPTAPIAPVAPTAGQRVNSNFMVYPNAYTYTYGSNEGYFTRGIPTAYLRNTNSVSWATNPPYGNPTLGYTNYTIRPIRPFRPPPPQQTNPPPQAQ